MVKRSKEKGLVARRHEVRNLVTKETEKVPVRWFQDFRNEFALQRNMDRLLDEISEDFGIRPMWLWEEPVAEITPRMEIEETQHEILISAELPGVEQKDVEVTLEGNTLRLRGQIKSEQEEKSKETYRSERFYGTFERAIQLPALVDAHKAEAHIKKGVLLIKLPKTESEKAHERKIEVKAA
jgi:HSP20 family protein